MSATSVLVQDLRNYKLLPGTSSLWVEVFPSQSVQRFYASSSRTIAELLQVVLPDSPSPFGRRLSNNLSFVNLSFAQCVTAPSSPELSFVNYGGNLLIQIYNSGLECVISVLKVWRADYRSTQYFAGKKKFIFQRKSRCIWYHCKCNCLGNMLSKKYPVLNCYNLVMKPK